MKTFSALICLSLLLAAGGCWWDSRLDDRYVFKCTADGGCLPGYHCADGVCCNAPCNGTCQACNLAGQMGKCTVVIGVDDPDTCTGPRACDALGDCKLKLGQVCTLASECRRDICHDGLCCNEICTGECRACNLAGTEGVCSPVTGVEDRDSCTGRSRCNDQGLCRLKTGESCSVTTPSQCATGYCVDQTCCSTACNRPCLNCSTGTCSQITSGDDNPECTGGNTCDPTGACKLKNGIQCVGHSECASGVCHQGRCSG